KSLQMLITARDILKENNFIHYEISNWCQPGKEARHNIVYWKNYDYIGVGVSAASFYKRKRYTNTHDLMAYLKKENFTVSEPVQDWQNELEETVFMNLRLLQEGLKVSEINQRFNIDLDDYYAGELAELTDKKLIVRDTDTIRLDREAVFISNEVFARFIK